jgi:transposase-like protein
MARKRVARGAGVKAKVALAALSGGSPTQIASRFGVHPTQVATWKKRLVEGAEELFADQRLQSFACVGATAYLSRAAYSVQLRTRQMNDPVRVFGMKRKGSFRFPGNARVIRLS